MTIAVLRGNAAFKSHTGGKGVKEHSDNGIKFRKYFLQTDLREASLKNDKSSSETWERRATDISCLEMTDAATETYFSDSVSIPPENNSTAQSPVSDFSAGAFLQSVICAGCRSEEDGIANVKIHISSRSYQIHKCAVVSKSGYLRRKLTETDEIELPIDFPGVETFELVIDFCKGSTILMEPSNVAPLRCAAEFLEMDEKQCRQNLSECTDKYLNEVVLQSWVDTSKVLQKCADLLPLAEKTFVVSRCIESLAFTACVELLEHEEREELKACQSSESHCWSEKTSGSVKEASPIWWIKDLLNLPSVFFGRIIKAFRKQGMSEKYVSLAIIKFVESWFFSDWLDENNRGQMSLRSLSPGLCNLLEDIVRLLPFVKYTIPVGFLFSFLRCAILLKASPDCRMHLEKRIASQLELATVHDFLMPLASVPNTYSRLDLDTMIRIVSIFISQNDVFGVDSLSSQQVSAVSKVWDEYLAQICTDYNVDARKFADLVEVIPSQLRLDHDQLYRTISIFLKAHPQTSQEERSLVCRSLNCQKLSQEACIHAVQNEFMPLRMIVQAMFVQHIQTRRVLNNQLRICNGVNFESLPPSGQLMSPHKKILSRLSRNDPFRLECSEEIGSDLERLPFGRSPDTNVAHLQANFLKSDLEETNDRLQVLEEELAHMRRTLSEASIKNRHCPQQTSVLAATSMV
ncbi:hypothetical protein O6H91_10G103700 [Diphasiastrum complanatum]|uniref:Uncharacterized protein n=2 Tax=Diphasiastrum complanatum TaxID=34168 RepID=A0ACC2CK63_DIPCM|nr:hypothetical protein O6H91_10G103700 [Diphasiastrum complanatum]KAJ7542377.1 hypothetical protein O6H91_10G103700 [Diphasiastrum complanatum]